MNSLPAHQYRNKSPRSFPIRTFLTNLSNSGRNRKQLLSMCVDGIVAMACLWISYSLRFGELFTDVPTTWHIFLLIAVGSVACFALLGVYRWVIRSTNLRLFEQLVKGSVLAGLCLLVFLFLLPPERSNPRSIFLIFSPLFFLGTAGVRIVWKKIFQLENFGQPVVVYGAGVAGLRLLGLLHTDKKYRPVLFIDDNEKLTGSTLGGVSITHPKDIKLQAKLQELEVSHFILAMPSLTAAEYHRKVQWLEPFGLGILTAPSVDKLLSGNARLEDIRDVTITDILGRSEVIGNIELMSKRVARKVVLVSGGGGSIGSELCRQIVRLDPEHLVILDSCEANLYNISEELDKQREELEANQRYRFSPVLGSITDKLLVDRLMKSLQVDSVFHAAAYKHVPIVEAHPAQGVAVNVFGTQNLLECALRHGVTDFVLISTDKAVRPANSMGASKRVAELILQAQAAKESATRISMVRFGNVLGSSGSVVPKFKQQILDGGPITLTHSDVTRYFMSIPEAAQLVLQASSIAQGGEVFVLDMGEPARIEEIAVTMVRLYGKSLKRETGREDDIDIQVTGLRPGEKLYEELFITANHRETEVEKISAASEIWLDWDKLAPELVKLQALSDSGDSVTLRQQLMKLAFSGRIVGDSPPDTNKSVLDHSDQNANKSSDVEKKGVLAVD